MNKDILLQNNLINKSISKCTQKITSILRVRKKMNLFIHNELLKNKIVYFVTFTFSDKFINFKRDSFCKYLRRKGIKAILYDDYGKEHNRLHYHGFISSDFVINEDFINRYGFVKLSLLKFDNSNYCTKYSAKICDEKINDRLKRVIIINGNK